MASDPELEHFRETVDCRTVLDRAGWKVDQAESIEGAVKFRRSEGEILIVTHNGRGWFDPLSKGQGLNEERGDVIALDQRLNGGSLGHVRKRLRLLSGVAPRLIPMSRPSSSQVSVPSPSAEPALRWRAAEPPRPGSAGWRYLSEQRSIPEQMIRAAVQADVLREGIYGTLWGAHHTENGDITGWEMRGPQFKGFSKGGDKSVFSLGERAADRIVVTEAMIDALSIAALERWHCRQSGSGPVLWISTGGGFGPNTERTLGALLRQGVNLVAATDRGIGGDRLAERLERLAQAAGAKFSRLVPPAAADWNDELRARPQPKAPAPAPSLSIRRV
ncbi:DUF3991 domain-containing protein [Dankookia rubra]|uniref:DUF3991 domain-containing protein n=1 Tax=Dankookia rubra TaxID=1442381 RepID=A0A4R5QDI0_9PROT|nr:DUF3991 and TOPRIM domain-containing protein [Dankookia rubra]TDH61232.1 DUF3991 domain-containing protein [Dankookia rubra]